MGCMNSDPDVRTHFRYVVDKVKFMQKSKRYQKKYDLFISHDRSKAGKALCTSLINAIRIATPNLRFCICTDKKIQGEDGAGVLEHAAASLNLCVLATEGCFQNPTVQGEIMAAAAEGARMSVISDVRTSPEILSDITKATQEVQDAFARPAVIDFSEECAQAAAMNLSDNLSFPTMRPLPVKTSCFRRRENPVVTYLYKTAIEDAEVANGFQAIANSTSPSTLNAPEMRENFLMDGGCEILVNKFGELAAVAQVAEAGMRAIANVSMNQEAARRMAQLGIVELISQCMGNHSEAPLIQGEACRALANMAADEEAKVAINNAKGFQRVLQTQKKWELEKDEDFRNQSGTYDGGEGGWLVSGERGRYEPKKKLVRRDFRNFFNNSTKIGNSYYSR